MGKRKAITVTLSKSAYDRLLCLQRIMGAAQRPCPLVKVPQEAVIERLLLDTDETPYVRT